MSHCFGHGHIWVCSCFCTNFTPRNPPQLTISCSLALRLTLYAHAVAAHACARVCRVCRVCAMCGCVGGGAALFADLLHVAQQAQAAEELSRQFFLEIHDLRLEQARNRHRQKPTPPWDTPLAVWARTVSPTARSRCAGVAVCGSWSRRIRSSRCLSQSPHLTRWPRARVALCVAPQERKALSHTLKGRARHVLGHALSLVCVVRIVMYVARGQHQLVWGCKTARRSQFPVSSPVPDHFSG